MKEKIKENTSKLDYKNQDTVEKTINELLIESFIIYAYLNELLKKENAPQKDYPSSNAVGERFNVSTAVKKRFNINQSGICMSKDSINTIISRATISLASLLGSIDETMENHFQTVKIRHMNIIILASYDTMKEQNKMVGILPEKLLTDTMRQRRSFIVEDTTTGDEDM